jgi:hypothetical protein
MVGSLNQLEQLLIRQLFISIAAGGGLQGGELVKLQKMMQYNSELSLLSCDLTSSVAAQPMVKCKVKV